MTKTLSCAESFTGGLFAKTITDIPGSSLFFKGGIITYWTDIKKNILGVSEKTIRELGVVSKECAIEMAEKCKIMFKSDFAISFTGVAGPAKQEEKEVGTIFIGIANDKATQIFEFMIKGDRQFIREKAVRIGLRELEKQGLNLQE